jgi:hypothetical protein
MEVTTYRWTPTRIIVPEPEPIRTRKEWRCRQVLLKRLSKAIDESIIRAMCGDSHRHRPQPESYPPKRERAPWPGVILNNVT